MIIHNINKFPEGTSSTGCKISELRDYDFDAIEGLGIDEIWYWYAYGGYEGMGWALMRKDDTYDLHDCGHCSCYGALDHFDPSWKSAEDIRDRYSSEAQSEVADLLKAAKL